MKRKLYLDAEIASMNIELKNVFPDPRVARHNLISVVGLDSYTLTYHVFVFRPDLAKKKWSEMRVLSDGKTYKVWIYTSGYEVDVIKWFFKLISKHDYDLVFGWNLVNFDIPYIVKRAEVLGLKNYVAKLISHTGMIDDSWNDIKIPGMQIFDLMTAAKKQLGKYEDGSLNAVSKRILGIGKLGDTVAVVSQWMHDLDLLIDYNIRDVELTYLLDTKMPLYNFFEEQMDLTGANIDETLTANYRVCQKYIMFEKAEHPFLDHFLCPSTDGDKKDFAGALNLTPQIGIHHWIAVHDLAMMYPNIMLAANMSPETVVRKEDFTDAEWKMMDPVHINGVYFRQDFVGFIPRLILKQIALRKAIEDRIEQFSVEYGKGFESTEIYKTYMTKRMNIKNLINSWYGVFGYEKFIMYNVDIAKSVTWLGKRQLEWSRDFVKKQYNRDTKYGDTDSIFIDTPPEIANMDLVDKLVLEMDTIDDMIKHKAVDEDMMELLRERKVVIHKLMDIELKKVEEYHDEIGDAITASYDAFCTQYNIKNHTFSMKFEKMYRRIFFSLKKSSGGAPTAAKKRYAGHIIFKDGKRVDKTDVSGFATRRSDSSAITRECQNELFRIITRSPNPVKESREHIRKYYLKVLVGDLDPNFVGTPNGFGKKLRNYKRKSRTYHWYAAQWANQNMGTNYDKGSKPKFIPLTHVPPPYNVTPFHPKNKDKWVAFDDDNPLKDEFINAINWPMVAERTIIGATDNIAQSIGITVSSIKTGLRRLSMEEAF